LELHLPLKSLTSECRYINEIQNPDIAKVSIEQSSISFTLSNQGLQNSFKNATDLGGICNNPKKFIVEFSSPNIAKPFHVGHLRSTIIGNFLSKLFKQLNHEVIQMNYLGDYGTQFGFLKVGIEMEVLSDDAIQKNPLQNLLRVYIAANSSKDPTVAERARQIFERMEFSEDAEIMEQWRKIKNYTLDELKVIYERLNVAYDVYEFESLYRRKNIEEIIEMMHKKKIIEKQDDGKCVVNVGDRKVPFIKSDSTTLYLTRDIGAFLSRLKKYEMDKTFYIVDNGQNDHFTAIKSVVNQLGFNSEEKIQHVKFGRIRGMSTRKGNVVFLKDIIDEAKDLMYKKQSESETTKVDLSQCGESIADILGVSAIIINDLKQPRLRDYDFEWNKTLQLGGDSGIKFQYTHCRLFNLEQSNQLSVEEAKELNLELLPEPEAQHLVYLILKYPQVIYHSYVDLEASVLTKYLFSLCNTTSKAFNVLTVKKCGCPATASQRLLLFNTTRKVLKHGLEILGLKVLNKM
jgi:arginyl-tRNA synthetase